MVRQSDSRPERSNGAIVAEIGRFPLARRGLRRRRPTLVVHAQQPDGTERQPGGLELLSETAHSRRLGAFRTIDRQGQTDHDEVGRATSCGPRTSRLMVKALCEEDPS